ncbi:MAG: hypothetical protein JWL75_691 [Parcubacteria group bacterium]|nr:hypothetical protein [Parcubacteria group bacterium]
MKSENGTVWQQQVLPIVLTLVVCAALIGLVYLQISLLNRFSTEDISLRVTIADILIGMTVYLKTSIDFALFIGNLMHTNGGWKNRISIELGTALGNALGTMAVLALWTFFREIDWLLAIMIVLAALVLFKLAESGLDHAKHTDRQYPAFFRYAVKVVEIFLHHVNWFTAPILRYILPEISMNAGKRNGFWALFAFAVVVPFMLGLDDFAGYVPLFSLVNVLGFSIGAFIAHAFLNILLYISPQKTIQAVKNPLISFIGSIAFVGLGAWGIFEALHLLFRF